jgi:carbon monoxide dehydrogenase subunit G
MKVAGEHTFKGSREQVWEMFRDTEVMSAALPGTKNMELVGENTYQAVMNVRVGPVAGEFSGDLVISNENYPESYSMTVEGRGKPGFMKGMGDIKLIDQGENITLMEYSGDVQIGGTLAGVGQRLIDTVSKSLINQAFETLDNVLAEKTAAASEGREAVYEEASQSDYATAVAKDFVGGIFSAPWAKWVLGILLLAIIGLVLLLSLT